MSSDEKRADGGHPALDSREKKILDINYINIHHATCMQYHIPVLNILLNRHYSDMTENLI